MQTRCEAVLIMPKNYVAMNAKEMSYVEGGGGYLLSYNIAMRLKSNCSTIAEKLIDDLKLKVIGAPDLAAEIYTHALLYYNPAAAVVAAVGLGFESYIKSIAGGIDFIDGLDTATIKGVARYKIYRAMYVAGPPLF